VRATIVRNRCLSPAYRHLGIAAPGFPPAFRAGEFVMVRPPWVGDPFLPRAYSLYRVSPAAREPASPPGGPVVEILYKVVGKGTHTLSRMEPGQEVELLGPLGNAFSVPAETARAVLVAGGIGVPPIAALAAQVGRERGSGIRDQGSGVRGQELGVSGQEPVEETGKARGTVRRGSTCRPPIPDPRGPTPTPHPPPPIPRIEVFLGGRAAEDILCAADFEAVGAGLHVTTEDGSLGTRGLVTDLLRPFLAGHGGRGDRIYACGPQGMLESVGRLAEAMAIPCELSLEANMACGFGACMGCAVPVRGPEPRYKLCCKDGPVFEASEVLWE
jgi:dihydroorotate dehydrogenase electron transfer subunit